MVIMRILFLVLLAAGQTVFAQNQLRVYIEDKILKEPLPGASVYFDSLKIGAAADLDGRIEITGIPNGKYDAKIACIGYEPRTVTLTFPSPESSQIKTYYLSPIELPAENIVVLSTTRNNGVEEDSPTRVEVLGKEEIDEEISIRPGNVSKLMGETSGILVQRTSPINGNVSFRLQGLPGEYTQLLKDGFPYFNGLSGGLSLLQIPPLDLRRVEVLKGSSSTFYGSGAIAGVVNLISRQPSETPEWNLILNRTSRKGTDIGSFYQATYNRIGISFLASQGLQDPVDINGDGFTDIPSFNQVTLNPKLIYGLSESDSLSVGLTSFFETRSGGDISAINNGPDSTHRYIEKNQTKRINTQLEYLKKLRMNILIRFKSSLNYIHRNIDVKNAYFSGSQYYSYSELSALFNMGNHTPVAGLNFVTDSFSGKTTGNSAGDKYTYSTSGFFVQDDWKIDPRLILQPAFRFDYHDKYGKFYQPHFSALYKYTSDGSIRLSAGTGYRTPTIDNTLSDREIVNGADIISANAPAEKSMGIELDLGYKYYRNPIAIKVNQAFFYTRVENPVIPADLYHNDSTGVVPGNIRRLFSRGLDTNLNIALDELNLFVDYSFTDVKTKSGDKEYSLFLTPKSKLNMTLTWEGEGSWRTGLEAFYTGSQQFDDSTRVDGYWVFGAMFEKIFHGLSIVGNVENIFDQRQTKDGPVVLPPYENPIFMPLYKPLDGIAANFALKMDLR